MDTDTWEPWMPAISSGSVWLYKIDFISWSSQNLWSKQSFGQYMKYLLVWNWVPLGKMINFGSLAQRNALDQWSNDPSLDRADQWSDESLSRVGLIDPDSPKGTHPLTSAGKRIIDRSGHFSFLNAEFLKGFSRYHAKRKKKPISWYLGGWFIFEFICSRFSCNWYDKMEKIYKLEFKSG